MEERLELQIERLFELAQRGSVATGRFFNPEEQYRAQQYLHQTGYAQDTYTFYGGYETAERKALICLPEWCQGTFEPSLAALCGVEIVGSSFRELSHPQYLGSLLSLGVERNTVGDVVPLSPYRAAVFVTEPIASFLLSDEHPLMRVASDTVKVLPFTPNADFCPERKTELICDTIASARLDCVVGALANLSREKAKAMLQSGKVRWNFCETTAPDKIVCQGDVVSITGAGRFEIVSCDEHTKKDRIRLRVKHYIS